MSLVGSSQVIVRGATVQFATNFYDVNNNLVQPDSATVNIKPSLSSAAIPIPMLPPFGTETRWTALWDTRNIAAPQAIYWSIHTGTGDPAPVVAEDGNFMLAANPANLVTF
jgi:hypothetical protein